MKRLSELQYFSRMQGEQQDELNQPDVTPGDIGNDEDIFGAYGEPADVTPGDTSGLDYFEDTYFEEPADVTAGDIGMYEARNIPVTEANPFRKKGVRVTREQRYAVYSKGGSIGSKNDEPVKVFDTAEEAKDYAKRMRKLLTPGERKHYGLGYTVKPLKEASIYDETFTGDEDEDDIKAAVIRYIDKVYPGSGIHTDDIYYLFDELFNDSYYPESAEDTPAIVAEIAQEIMTEFARAGEEETGYIPSDDEGAPELDEEVEEWLNDLFDRLMIRDIDDFYDNQDKIAKKFARRFPNNDWHNDVAPIVEILLEYRPGNANLREASARWHVRIPANVYDGRHYDYRYVAVAAPGDTAEEAVAYVKTHPEEFIPQIEAMRVGNRRKVQAPVEKNVWFDKAFAGQKILEGTVAPRELVDPDSEYYLGDENDEIMPELDSIGNIRNTDNEYVSMEMTLGKDAADFMRNYNNSAKQRMHRYLFDTHEWSADDDQSDWDDKVEYFYGDLHDNFGDDEEWDDDVARDVARTHMYGHPRWDEKAYGIELKKALELYETAQQTVQLFSRIRETTNLPQYGFSQPFIRSLYGNLDISHDADVTPVPRKPSTTELEDNAILVQAADGEYAFWRPSRRSNDKSWVRAAPSFGSNPYSDTQKLQVALSKKAMKQLPDALASMGFVEGDSDIKSYYQDGVDVYVSTANPKLKVVFRSDEDRPVVSIVGPKKAKRSSMPYYD